MPQNTPPDIGQKIKHLRSSKNLTLDQLANMSGVSKSMLSQIERNKTNPTVGTLWSLTGALGMEIGELLGSKPKTSKKPPSIATMKAHETPEIQSADGKCILRILGPLELVSHIEWYDIRIEKGGILSSEPHVLGTREHLTVLEGEINIYTADEDKILSKGDTARYNADVQHNIKNTGKSEAHIILIVNSPK